MLAWAALSGLVGVFRPAYAVPAVVTLVAAVVLEHHAGLLHADPT